jgi:predicted  nucleic acid-binding Zn-ribbon protein
VCPAGTDATFPAGFQRGREIYDLRHRLDTVNEQIRKTRAALTAGIPDQRARADEAERLESLSREAEQLEQKIAALEGR